MAYRPANHCRSGLAEAGRAALTCRPASPGLRAESLCAGPWPAVSPGAVAWTALLCAQPRELAQRERVEPLDRPDQQGHFWSGLGQTLDFAVPTGSCGSSMRFSQRLHVALAAFRSGSCWSMRPMSPAET